MTGIFGAPRPAQQPRGMNGVWRARVTRVEGLHTYVEIPRLARGREYGPVEQLQGPWTMTLSTQFVSEAPPITESTDPGDGHGHTHVYDHQHDVGVDLAPGDRVLVAFLEGSQDEPVILGRLA